MKTYRRSVNPPARPRRVQASRPLEPLVAEVTSQELLLRPNDTLPIEIYDARRIAAFEAEEADLAKLLARKKGRS